MPVKDLVIQTLEAMRREAANKLSDAEGIVNRAETEDRELTAEEQLEYDGLVAEAAELERRQADEQRQTTVSAQKQAIADIRGRFNARPTPQDILTRGAVAHVTHLRQMWTDDPQKGYPSHRAFLMDVIRAGISGRESDQLQYLKIRSAAGGDEHSTFSDPYGGYLLPIGFSPTMLRVDPEADPTMGRTMMVPMNVPIVGFAARVDKDHTNSVSGGLRVYRRAEADTVTPSRMEMELITLRANPLMGVSFATEELLNDSPQSFVAIISAGFQDEFNSRVLDERLNGTGVGEYLGLLKSPALVSETRQLANEINYLDILNMRARTWRYENAVWMANHDTIPQLGQLNLQVGAGGSAIWMQSAQIDLPGILLGRPIFFTEYMKSLGTAGDIGCINWTQYLEGIYQPLQSAESIHVRFVNNERAFRFTMRNDGAPWWRAALTPKNSTKTLSPYVTLAA